MQTQTMLQRENLKGKVKSVYVTDGDAYVKVYFDTTGKIIKKENYWRKDYIIVRDDYVYDDKGRLISVKVNNWEFLYIYDDAGNVVFIDKDSTGIGAIYYKYDKRGNCVYENRTSNNAGNRYMERVFNEKNQLVEAFSYWECERLNVWHTDSTGRREYETTEWGDPIKENHTFYQYNRFGDVSRITIKAENGETIKTCSVVYDKYDDAGNWLVQRTRPANFSFEQDLFAYFEIYNTFLGGNRITRIIEYYK